MVHYVTKSCLEVFILFNDWTNKIFDWHNKAPKVKKGKAADIYSFGMIMYSVATGRQPLATRTHDQNLALSICNGIRPKINEPEAPKCYIDLMKKCWDSNPDNRPNATEIKELIYLFYVSNYCYRFESNWNAEKEEIAKQIKEAEEYRETNPKNNQQTTHPEACYTSRILNPFTKDLQRYDNINNNSVEITDFTEYVTFI